MALTFGSSAGESLPKITVDDFGGCREAVWTISGARFVNFTDQRTGLQTERTLFVSFAEHPGKELKCNRTMGAGFEKLVRAGKLPGQADGAGNPLWTGCRCPLELRPYRNPNGGEFVEKATPVHPDLFQAKVEAHFAALMRPQSPGGASASVARKPTTRRRPASPPIK